MKAVYRVNYYVGGVSKTGYVAADSEGEASAFVGVRDGSASVSAVASPVEVVGLDKAHDALVSPPINFAPPQEPKQLTPQELSKLREILARDSAPVLVPKASSNQAQDQVNKS